MALTDWLNVKGHHLEDQSYYSKGQSQQDYSDKGTKYTQETQADSKPSTKE